MAVRRSRRSPSVPIRQLDEQQIVEAALRLVRKTGTENVSMRALATELGVSPMSIYYYLPSKGALLDKLVDAVLSQVPMPAPDPARWQAQLKACSLAAFNLLAPYPGLSGVMLARGNTKAGRVVVRYSISILLAAGFEAREAALAVAAYNTYMYGVYAGLNAYRRKLKGPARPRAQRMPIDVEDGVSAVIGAMRGLQAAPAIDFGLDVMLSGIASLARGRPPKRKQARAPRTSQS